jgi:hypothetical protein
MIDFSNLATIDTSLLSDYHCNRYICPAYVNNLRQGMLKVLITRRIGVLEEPSTPYFNKKREEERMV